MAGGGSQQVVTHLKRTLTSTETDVVISQTCASEAMAAERARRAGWLGTVENAASFATSLTKEQRRRFRCWGQSGHGLFGQAGRSLTQNGRRQPCSNSERKRGELNSPLQRD